MTRGGPKKRLFGVGMLLLGVAVLTACPEQDPVDEILAPGTGGEAVANFLVSSGEGFGAPSGSIAHRAFALAFVPPGESDVFGRATGDLGFFDNDPFFGEGSYGLQGAVGTAATDPRLPALDAATPDAQVLRFCVLGTPWWTGLGEGAWDLFCEVAGLKPNTTYTIALARYSLTVNGVLDLQQVLLGENVDDPDELVLLGGTPQGYPTTLCNFSTLTPILRDANPLVLGYQVSDALGQIRSIDCIPFSDPGDPTWWQTDADKLPAAPEDSLPFLPNRTGTLPGQSYTYNYLLVIEGQGDAANPVPTGPTAMRFQIGVDFDSNGDPINDAFGPFATGPLTASQLETVRGVLHPAASEVTLGNLKPLAGAAVYQSWLVNLITGASAPAVGTVTEHTAAGDVTTPGTAIFNPESSASTFTIDFSAASAGVSMSDFSHYVVTYESGPGSTTASDQRFLFLQYIDRSGTNDGFSDDIANAGSLIIGVPAANPAGFARSWGFAGGGIAHFFGDEFRARVENIARPPVGFAYYGWLVGTDDQGSTVYHALGPVTVDNPPDYTPLVDADITRNIPSAESSVVAETFIARAINRVLVDDVSTLQSSGARHAFCDVTNYWITLEPKAGDLTQPSPTVAITGAAPETFLNNRDLCPVPTP